MKEEDKKRIIDIIDGMHCPKDFLCVEFGFERLCKVKDIGSENHLLCLHNKKNIIKQVYPCIFTIRCDNTNFCQCPLRVYIAKKLKK